MRSALKRDLDANIFPQPGDESDASRNAATLPAASARPARPRIVTNDAPEGAAVESARDEAVKAVSTAAAADVGTPVVSEPTPAADALLGDLKRIMASLTASREAEPAVDAAPEVAVHADAAPSDAAPDGKPLGAVAAAALRAFRQADNAPPRPAPGNGARLLAAEAERIAAEREQGGPLDEPSPAKGFADLLFSSSSPAAEPYDYGRQEEIPASDASSPELPDPEARRPAIHPSREPVVSVDAGPELAPPAATRDWLELPEDEFAPPRYRAEGSGPRRASKGFAFDIHAFVNELEREAADAGREWSAQEGAALFAKDRVARDIAAAKPAASRPAVSEPAAGQSADGQPQAATREVAESHIPDGHVATDRAPAEPAAAPLEFAPAVTPVDDDPPPPVVEPVFQHMEPPLPAERSIHPANEPTAAPVRRSRARRDTFTWKRLALLSVFVTLAGVGAMELQSIAARNDIGSDDARVADAAVASVAPQEEGVAAAAPAAPVRDVTPTTAAKSKDTVPTSTPQVAVPTAEAGEAEAAPALDMAPTLRPSVVAEAALGGAVAADGGGAVPVATPEASDVQADAEPIAEAPSGFAPLAPEPVSPSADEEVQAGDTDSTFADEPVSTAAAPVPPAPQARPVQVAAATPAPSGASPSGMATIRSGVTLRAGADNGAAAIGTLKGGQKVELVGCKLWCEIVANGKRGFVFNKFLDTGAAAR